MHGFTRGLHIACISMWGLTCIAKADEFQTLALSTVFITADAQIKGTVQRRKVTGSGVIITSDGYVLTAAHVLPNLADPSTYEDIHLTGAISHNFAYPIPLTQTALVNADADVVVLKFPSGISYTPAIVEQDPVDQDSSVTTMSFPYGLDLNKLDGKISSLNGPGTSWLTNASVQEGSSGGPVFDSKGRLVGILSGGYQYGLNPHALGLNLIIPISIAKSVASGLNWKTTNEPNPNPLKVCADPANGVDHYAQEFDTTKVSAELGPGHGEDEWCGEAIKMLKGEQPEAVFSVVSKSETSRSHCQPFNCPLYTYMCTIHVKAEPVYVVQASASCK